jgi:hypothetical protein
VVGAVLLPASAQAGTASPSTAVPGGLVSYVAAEGETNNVSVFVNDGKLVIADAAPVTASSSCTLNSFGDAECPAGARMVNVLLRDKNDTIVYRAPHQASVSTEGGGDVILGGLRQTDTGRSIQPVFYFGNDGRDTISYAAADRVPAATSWVAGPATTSSSRASSARAAPTRSTAPTETIA